MSQIFPCFSRKGMEIWFNTFSESFWMALCKDGEYGNSSSLHLRKYSSCVNTELTRRLSNVHKLLEKEINYSAVQQQ